MTHSQDCRRRAMDLLRRLAPADYLLALEREREAEQIALNACRVELPQIEMRRVGSGPLATWLEAA